MIPRPRPAEENSTTGFCWPTARPPGARPSFLPCAPRAIRV
jgi:hypothetical protein